MAAIQLSDAERNRRDKVIAQLASDNEHTVLVAMSVLKRMAAEHNIPVYEYINDVSAAPSSDQDRARAERAEREAREANERATRAEAAARAAREAQHPYPAQFVPVAPTMPPDWRQQLQAAHHPSRDRKAVPEPLGGDRDA
jgi:hypothetical protein